MLRVVIQLLLGFPVVILGALAWPFLLSPFVPGFWTGAASRKEIGSMLFLAAGAYGCLALPLSVAMPASFVRNRRWLQIGFSLCLVGGSYVSVTALGGVGSSGRNSQNLFSTLWLFGGPLIVAVWNLWRFWQKPNSGSCVTRTPPPADKPSQDF